MPLFGKKEKSSSGAAANAVSKPAYPTQNMAAYPTQNTAAYPPQGYAPAYPGSGAPPPYSEAVQPNSGAYQPVASTYAQVAGSQPYAYGPPPPPAQTVVVQGGFDAGARFDANTRATIPPPPPGCPMHPAQMAAFQGSNVVVTQRPGNFWTGGSDGGWTL